MRIHFIGIAGIGMSAIAQIALKAGHVVSGSDIKENILTKQLSDLGARIFIGHNRNNLLDSIEVVVHSSAIPPDNVEITRAKNNNIAIWQRAQMLKFLMEDKTTITVTGSHGKTTTSSLISHIFISARLDPTIAIGGVLGNVNNNALLGNGEYFIAEADESDGSFLYYEPNYSVITNVDYEHLDYYKDIDSIKECFIKFMNRTKKDGCLFCCGDDPILRSISKQYKNRLLFFGLDSALDIYAHDIKLSNFSSNFCCVYNGKDLGRFNLGIAGRHNIYNALASVALGIETGIDRDTIALALENFKGARRRFQVKFNSNEILVVDDYAHHPTEIKAVLSTCRNILHKRLVIVFQPHRYTRTKYLFDKFTNCFDDIDLLFITQIYPANEPSLEGISAKSLSDAIKNEGVRQTQFLDKKDIANVLLDEINPGDLIIFLGAGDITKICDDFVEKLPLRSFVGQK